MAWLTSDNPVVCLNYYHDGKYDFKGGWGKVGTEIFLPLSPSHLMFTQIGKKPHPRGTVVSAELATAFQRLIVEHAHRYVFGSSPNSQVETWRPRVIDACAFNAERVEWQKWNTEQFTAEREFLR